MNANSYCIICHLHQAMRIADSLGLDEEKRFDFYKNVCKCLSDINYPITTLEIADIVYKKVKEMYRVDDVFQKEKNASNKMAEEIINYMEEKHNIDNLPLKFAIKMSAIGNLIDLGADSFDVEKLTREILNKIKTEEFTIDKTKEFQEKLMYSNSLLYILDNAGEAIFDKKLIQVIKKRNPQLKVYITYRSTPVINDMTYIDCIKIGLDKEGELLDSGSVFPGILYNYTSEEFQQIYNDADIVLSKGQGNFEGLIIEKNKKIFFCLTAKCEPVSRYINVPIRSLIFSNFENID